MDKNKDKMKTEYMQSTHNPFNSQGKMFKHLDKLNEYVKNGDVSAPILIEVNLTNICPLKCKWCISSYAHKDEKIDTLKLFNFLKEFKDAGGKSINWSGGGEPTGHPDFAMILQKTHEIGLDQGLMTSGLYKLNLNQSIEKYCKWIRYSIDTANQNKYKEIKGVDAISKVLAVIKNIDKSKIKVGINMNLPQEQGYIREVYDLLDLSSKLNVEYFQIRPVLPRNYADEQINQSILSEQIDFLKTIDGITIETMDIYLSWDKFHDLNKSDFDREYKKCRGHIFECVLDANGDLVVCMYFLKEDAFVFGNIYKQSFKEIWNSEKRKKIKIMCDTMSFNNCQVCCKCHEINKLIDYIDSKTEDKNFI